MPALRHRLSNAERNDGWYRWFPKREAKCRNAVTADFAANSYNELKDATPVLSDASCRFSRARHLRLMF